MDKKERAEYGKEYYLIHKEEITKRHREYDKKYYLTYREKVKTRTRLYRLTHKEEVVKRDKQYKLTHKKECMEYGKEYYQTYREKILKYRKEYQLTLRKEVLTHYGGGKLACVRCGYDNIGALALDHVNGGGTEHRRSLGGRDIFNWIKASDYPEGFQTLCRNCNWLKMVENEEGVTKVKKEDKTK